MRINKGYALLALVIAGGLGHAAMALDGMPKSASAPALAFDGTPAPRNMVPLDPDRPALSAPQALSPIEAFRSGARALKAGETAKAVTSLEYAAEQGHTAAAWKLGRMYADGDGVQQDELRAFRYFSRIANSHADESPQTPQSRFVASAFVALGNYYLDGIPNTDVQADPVRAREMYAYAASYFGDPDAQYNLARLYLDGKGAPRDGKQATRWLGLAASKGQHQAQALLGHMLVKGDKVPRQSARGLMYLTLARDAAGPSEQWIIDLHDVAMRQASPDERQMALTHLERWLKGRRE
jgi:TPR repeat protein